MLNRYDPFRDMWALQNIVNRWFDEVAGPTSTGTYEWAVPLDVVETPDQYLVKVSVPGLRPDDLDITYTNGTLSIRGEVKDDLPLEDKEHKQEMRYHLRERRFGSFQRSLVLPGSVQADKIEAQYESGILTLVLPKTEEIKPKRIAIRSDEQKMIEGGFNRN